MKIGRLRHKVVFQSYTTTSDGAGGSVASWTNDTTCFAMIEPLNTSEVFELGQEADNNSYRIIVRFTDNFGQNLNSQYRILYNGRTFNIKRIRNLRFDHRFFEIYAVEK